MSRREHCPFSAEHINDPCPCGWSSKDDRKELVKEIMRELVNYLNEIKDSKKQYDILAFVDWLKEKSK